MPFRVCDGCRDIRGVLSVTVCECDGALCDAFRPVYVRRLRIKKKTKTSNCFLWTDCNLQPSLVLLQDAPSCRSVATASALIC